MADIFISHAKKDLPLVDALVQLIEGGVGIRSSQIFCTSIEEQAIPPGIDFKSHIKSELAEVRVVISVVTPQYYSSAFCMCELGATWALTKDFIPLLVPPIDYSEALYYSMRQKQFFPRRDEWLEEEPEKAVEQRLLSSDEAEFWPNQAHPKVKRALTALENLQRFVDEPPQGFAEKYQGRYDDLFDMSSRPFWERHHLF